VHSPAGAFVSVLAASVLLAPASVRAQDSGVRAAPAPAAPCADLTGSYTSVSLDCKYKSGVPTCTVKATDHVSNPGSLKAPSSRVQFILSDDTTPGDPGDLLLKDRNLDPVGPAKFRNSKLKSKLAPGLLAANKYLITVVDAGGAIPECIESNNQVATRLSLPARSLGKASASGPFPPGGSHCPAGSGYPCVVVKVQGCPDVTEAATARLYIGDPTAGPPAGLGTVTFQQGGRSNALWQNALLPDNLDAMDTLRDAGFRTIQIVWDTPGWNSDVSAPGFDSTEMSIACRPATLYKYIYDTWVAGTATPLCSIGSSSGSESIAWSLSDYGGKNWFNAVYLSGGPYGTRMDLGCLQAPLSGGGSCESFYGYPARDLVDEGFGNPDSDGDGTTDCTEAWLSPPTAEALAVWKASSLGYASTGQCADLGEYYFPGIYVSFRHGALDSVCNCTTGNCGNSPHHQDLYIAEMDNSVRGGATSCHPPQPLMDDVTVPATAHTINETPTGVADWLAWVWSAGPSAPNKCRFWP
jgi:hypothetical protein